MIGTDDGADLGIEIGVEDILRAEVELQARKGNGKKIQ